MLLKLVDFTRTGFACSFSSFMFQNTKISSFQKAHLEVCISYSSTAHLGLWLGHSVYYFSFRDLQLIISICSRHNPGPPNFRLMIYYPPPKDQTVSRSWCKLHAGVDINQNQLVLTQKKISRQSDKKYT